MDLPLFAVPFTFHLSLFTAPQLHVGSRNFCPTFNAYFGARMPFSAAISRTLLQRVRRAMAARGSPRRTV